MCYSAQVHAEYSKFRRETGAAMDLDSCVRLFWWNERCGRDNFSRGYPLLVRGEAARRVFDTLAERSREYGTVLRV